MTSNIQQRSQVSLVHRVPSGSRRLLEVFMPTPSYAKRKLSQAELTMSHETFASLHFDEYSPEDDLKTEQTSG